MIIAAIALRKPENQEKVKEVFKKGWKPAGDRQIHRDTWKSDVMGMATGKKKDPYEASRNHQSSPLATLKDPDSFGPPPKHSAYYPNAITAGSSSSTAARGGLGAAVPASATLRIEDGQAQEQEEAATAVVVAEQLPVVPYRKDTTGLRTDHLPKPPVRRANGDVTASPVRRTHSETLATPARTSSPSLPPRQTTTARPALPALPTRQASKPPPVLPPRMTENPNEYTPPPPPTYGEAVQAPSEDPAIINAGAAARLGQAGVSVPAFDVGAQSAAPRAPRPPPAQPRGPELSELQARFARMNSGAEAQASPAPSPARLIRTTTDVDTQMPLPTSPASVAGKKKPPPPPPPKKSGLGGKPSNNAPAPPPVPMSSKPRPGG
ncbi:hypothetical protein BAUCODRAFT_27705 [Baudoinia panamericana UAMH 10762]|uniref:Uncharacterized protein n=1 Tax=Baudoinia panamericana (strain UAMH 10762) TaxID=717646 RepID=M2MM15_BAUPA|nr:uncharacterized protein BAUCODRAFT_27705 [Baudoinia panamericana UAMH 10762]EMC92418.1 hypothetical protein BAUCODRAFT_27705 [Baudoinia panamericana UAMH 10762]